MKRLTPETSEKKVIKNYLALKNCYWYHNLAGLGCFPGLPDITAITPKGVVLQIEVKCKGYQQSENQIRFQREWESQGGTYICGDLDTVIKYFEKGRACEKKNL